MKITKSQLRQIIKEELSRLTEADWDHPPEPAGSLGGYGDTDLYGVDDESDEHTDNDGPDMDEVQLLVYRVIEHLESMALKDAIKAGRIESISAEINRVLGIMKTLEKEVGQWIHPNFR